MTFAVATKRGVWFFEGEGMDNMPQESSSPQAPKITLSKSVKTVNSSSKLKFKVMPNPWISTTELYSQEPNSAKF